MRMHTTEGCAAAGRNWAFPRAGVEWLRQDSSEESTEPDGWKECVHLCSQAHDPSPTVPKAEISESHKECLRRVANLLGGNTGAERLCSHLQFLWILISVNTSHHRPRVTCSPGAEEVLG